MSFAEMRLETFNAVLDTFGEEAVLVIDSIEQPAITVRFLSQEDDQGASRSYRRSADDYNYQGVASALAGYMARTRNTDLQAMPALKSGDIAYIRGNVYRVTKIKQGLVSTDIHLNDTGEAAP